MTELLLEYNRANTQVLELLNLQARDPTTNQRTPLGASATVLATIYTKRDGQPVAGLSSLAFTYRSPGEFYHLLDGTELSDEADRYEVEAHGDDGQGSPFAWRRPLTVKTRRSGEPLPTGVIGPAPSGATSTQSVAGSIGPSGIVARRTSRALSGSLGMSGALSTVLVPGGSSLPAGDDDLITAIGDANIGAFYDSRGGITLNGSNVSQWDDVRGASGYAIPLSQATAARQPAYDAINEIIEFPGDVTRKTLFTAADAMFDLSTARAMVLIGAVSNPALGDRYAALVQDGAFARYLGVRLNASNTDIAAITSQGNHFPVVAGSTTPRLIIVAKNATTTSWIEIPNDARVSGSGGSTASGNNRLSVGAFTDNADGATFSARAVLWLNKEPSAADITALKTYATTHRGVTLV